MLVAAGEILNWIQALGPFASLAAVLVALYAVRASFRFRRELSVSEQIANVPEWLRNQYWERKIEPPIDYKDEDKTRHELRTLRDVRRVLSSELSAASDEAAAKLLEQFLSSTRDKNDWQNRVAWELSNALEDVGVMVLAGAIPLRLVLAADGPQILRDWGYCRVLVEEKLWKEAPIEPKAWTSRSRVYFGRRHAKWLACAAAIYMDSYWKLEVRKPHRRAVLAWIRREGLEALKTYRRDLEALETPLIQIPKATRQEIKELLDE